MILQGCHKSEKPGKILILAKIKENLVTEIYRKCLKNRISQEKVMEIVIWTK